MWLGHGPRGAWPVRQRDEHRRELRLRTPSLRRRPVICRQMGTYGLVTYGAVSDIAAVAWTWRAYLRQIGSFGLIEILFGPPDRTRARQTSE